MTFLQSINLVGDYVLNKAIGEVDAGACVTQVHKFCKCKGTTCGGRGHKYLYSCFGACASPTTTCC
jgi:hypothetical protein